MIRNIPCNVVSPSDSIETTDCVRFITLRWYRTTSIIVLCCAEMQKEAIYIPFAIPRLPLENPYIKITFINVLRKTSAYIVCRTFHWPSIEFSKLCI